jgi:hypothetical protein
VFAVQPSDDGEAQPIGGRGVRHSRSVGEARRTGMVSRELSRRT